MVLPNIGLEQSTIGVTTDPLWAEHHEENWNLLDAHDHTAGKGASITPEAININEDLSMQGYNLIDLRSPIFQNLSTDPSNITDLCSLYFKNGNLWLNNGAGGHVQVSNGSGLNISTGVSNLYTTVLVSTSTTILNTDDYTYIEVDTTSAINLFLPSAGTVAAGRFYYIKDITGLAGTNAITLVPTGGNTIDASTSNYIMKRNFGSWLLVSDGSTKWFVSNFSNKEMNDGTWNSVGYAMNIDAKANTFNLKNNVAPNAFTLNGTNGTAAFFTTVQLSQDVRIGGSGTNTLIVESLSTFKNDVILGLSIADSLTINSELTINNSTLTFTSSLLTYNLPEIHNFDNTFNSDVSIGSGTGNTLTVDAITQFLHTVTVDNDMTIGSSGGDVLTVNSGSTFNNNVTLGSNNSDTLTVNSVATFYDDLNVGGDFALDGDGILGTDDSNTVTLNAVIQPNNGRILDTYLYVTTDTDQTIDITLNKIIFNTSAAMTAARTYTITGATARDGDTFQIQNESSSFSILLAGLVSGTISTNKGAEYTRVAGTFRRSMSWGF